MKSCPAAIPLFVLALLHATPGLLADPGRAGPAQLSAESLPGPSLRLSWPETLGRATLETSPSLGSAAVWQPVPGVPTQAAGVFSITLEAFEWEQYFRLRLASPGLRADLASDTGLSRTDRITSIPTVVGSVPDRGSIRAFQGSLDGATPAVSLLEDLQPDGGFVLDAGRLAEIAGGVLTDGPHRLRLTAEGTAGSTTEQTLSFVLDTTPPTARISPSAGAAAVLPNEMIEATFGEPVAAGELAFDGTFVPIDATRLIALERLGVPVSGSAYFDPEGARLGFVPSTPLSVASTYTWTIANGRILDRAGNAARIVPDRGSFRTAGGLGLPGTSVAGSVYDSVPAAGGANRPLAGATAALVSDRSRSTLTDSQGRFVLHDVPGGKLMVEVDGRTVATAAGTFYPTVTELIEIVPGRTNTFPAPIFLPLARETDFATLDNRPGATTAVANPAQLPGWSLLVPGGAVQRRDGSLAGRILIAPVPPDRLPAPLPPGFDPEVVITVQSEGGADVFAQPVPLTAPNLENLPPGSKTVLWDFDHARGDFVPAATMTVSADGLTVSTDPGQGVVRPGWHLVGRLLLGRLHASDTVDHKNNGNELTPEQRDRLAKLLNEAILTLEKTAVDTVSAVPMPGPAGTLANYGLNGLGNAISGMRGAATAGNPQSAVADVANVAGNTSLTALNAATLSAAASAAAQQGLSLDAQQIRDAVNGNPDAVQGLRDAVQGKQNARRVMNELGKLGKAANALNSIASAVSAVAEWRRLVNLIEAINQLLEDPPGDDASRMIAAMTTHLGTALDGAVDAAEVHLRAGVATTLTAQMVSLTHEWPTSSDRLSPALRADVLRLADAYDANATRLGVAESRMRSTFPKALDALSELKQVLAPTVPGRVYYKVALSDGTVLRGSADGADFYSVRFSLGTANESAQAAAATVGNNRIGFTSFGIPSVPPAVGVFDAPTIFLGASRAADANANGIADDVEEVLSAAPLSRTQAADLKSGLSPEAAGLDLSGVVSRLPLPAGTISDLAASGTTVYAASSRLGLIIADYTDPLRPTFVNQVFSSSVPGRLSAQGNRLAVAYRDGRVAVFDITTPMRPFEIVSFQRDRANLAPALVLGPWLVLQNAGTLEVYPTDGTTLIDSRPIPGTGPVADLHASGGTIYVVRGDASPTLTSMTLAPDGKLPQRSSVTLSQRVRPELGLRLTGGLPTLNLGGLTAEDSEIPGFLRVDISDPTRLVPGTFTAAQTTASSPNGAGGWVALRPGTVPPEIAVYPGTADAPTTRISTGTPGTALLLLDAYAIVGTREGDAGSLMAIRLPGTDTAGIAPSLAFVGLGNGFEIVEGRTVPISVQATDDVRMARVDLLFQGNNRVATDASFPFDLAFAPPEGLPEIPVTLTALAIDAAGNSSSLTLTGRYRAVPPRIVATSPPPGSSADGEVSSVRLVLSEAIDRRALPDRSAFRLAASGPDHTHGTSDDLVLPVLDLHLDTDGRAVSLGFGRRLEPESYRLTVADGALRDLGGLTLDGEPNPSFPTGDGRPGGVFVLNFATLPSPPFEIDTYPLRILGSLSPTGPEVSTTSGPFLLADFDRDGRQDIAVPRYEPSFNATRFNVVDVLLQGADGSFAAALPQSVGPKPVGLAAGDVDGDGNLDLVTLNWQGDEGIPENRQRRPFSFSILLGRGDGSFDTERRIESGRTMAEVGVLRVGDFTGDGRADLAVLVPDFHENGYDDLEPDPAEVLIFRSTGAGALAPPTETRIPFGRAFSAEREILVTGHFDGDRHLDAIVNGFSVLTGPSELQGRVLLGRGDGTFESRISPTFGQRGREWRLLIADWNRDGFDDALYGTNVYRNLGDATFAAVDAAGLSSIESSRFTSGVVGPLDSDGIPDLVVRLSYRIGNGLATFAGRGDGTFVPTQRVLESGPNDLGTLGIADLNQDGFGDLILPSGTSFSGDDLPAGFLPLISRAGRFPTLASTSDAARLRLRQLSPSLGTGPATADFDGDGRDDLIGFSNTGEFGLILATTDGFGPIRRFASPSGFFPYSQWPGDLDGDGRLDLVVGDQFGTPRTFYYLGDGAGGFGAPVEIPDNGKLLHFLDLDGDRRPDLVSTVARTGGASAGNFLRIRTNLGGGSFSAPIESRIAGIPRSVFPIRWDADALPDLAVDYSFGTGVAVLLQRSGGLFETGPSTGRQDTGFSLAGVGDFDGDGRPDLLMRTTSATDSRLQLWPGAGNGALGTPYPAQSTTLAGPEALSIHDFNGDGALDLLGRPYTADAEARIALGDGRGRFAQAIRFGALPQQSTGGDAVLAGDFDGDGLPDLFVAGVVLPHKPR